MMVYQAISGSEAEVLRRREIQNEPSLTATALQ